MNAIVLAMSLWAAGVSGSPPASELPVGIQCLLKAYPQHLCSATATTLVGCDGRVFPYDDGVAKPDHDQLLDTADLEDQMAQRYPLGRDAASPPAVNFEPGRVRNDAFFRWMYGNSRAEVRSRLETVRWLPSTVNRRLRVTGVNDVHLRLQAVSDEVDRLPARIKGIVEKSSGTFNWRMIRGTNRLSMHSFAIAVDVGVSHSDYWRWRRPRPDGTRPYRNRIPLEVVEIFERHGFIWGGKWYHFDTMHFEYRPELLADPCVERPAAEPEHSR